jgi:hypothetical protein
MDFGRALKEKLKEKEDARAIGSWAFSVYLENIQDIVDHDNALGTILLTLNHMEEGSEFELSLERLNEVADDLIAGIQEINLDY